MFNPSKDITSAASSSTQPKFTANSLVGDGEMARLMRAYDWSKSILGPIEQWPISLITAVNIILASRFPMIIYWGPELISLYNDGYAPIFGIRHPDALGKPCFEVWSEIRNTIQPMFEKVTQGESTWSYDQLLLLTRNGYLEECYFTWSFSPIRNEIGQVAGILAPITETTQRVLGEKRLSLSRELGSKTVNVKTFDEACAISVEALSRYSSLFPFACFYYIDESRKRLILKNKTWPKEDEVGIPTEIDLTEETAIIQYFQSALESRAQIKLTNPDAIFEKLPAGPWPKTPRLVIAKAITPSEIKSPLGLLILAINPRRAYDKDYEAFIELVSDQITNALSMGKSYEKELSQVQELTQLNNAKTVFFNNINHEFRTPLALMLGPLADSLADKENPLPLPQHERQVMIQSNALRLLRLVNTLLDFSRIERKQLTHLLI